MAESALQRTESTVLIHKDLDMVSMLMVLTFLLLILSAIKENDEWARHAFMTVPVIISYLILKHGSKVIQNGGYHDEPSTDIALKTILKCSIISCIGNFFLTKEIEYRNIGLVVILLLTFGLYLMEKYDAPFDRWIRLFLSTVLIFILIFACDLNVDYISGILLIYGSWPLILAVIYLNYETMCNISQKVHRNFANKQPILTWIFRISFIACALFTIFAWITVPEIGGDFEYESLLPDYHNIGLMQILETIIWGIFGLYWVKWAFGLSKGCETAILRTMSALFLFVCVFWMFESLLTVNCNVAWDMATLFAYRAIAISVLLFSIHLNRRRYSFWALFLLLSCTIATVLSAFFGYDTWYLNTQIFFERFLILIDFLTVRGYLGKEVIDSA